MVVFCPGGHITASYPVPYQILSAHAHMLNTRAEAARVCPVQVRHSVFCFLYNIFLSSLPFMLVSIIILTLLDALCECYCIF